MPDTNIKRVVNDVGMSTFIKYYYIFKKRDRTLAITSIEENYTEKSKGTRTSKAHKIFDENLHLAVLELIMQSDRAKSETIIKAQEIYRAETGKAV